MNGILDIFQKPVIDESIIKKEYHTYLPYLQTFKNSDEIRIAIQNQDIYVLPSKSLLYIEGVLKRDQQQQQQQQNDEVINIDIRLKNNIVGFLFDDIRYEINGMEVDKTRHLGIATSIKNCVSLTPNESVMMENGGWSMGDITISNFKIALGIRRRFQQCYIKL